MRISILIPAYNNSNLLYRCLDSILNQSSLKNIEVLVSDDNSSTILFNEKKFLIYKKHFSINWFRQKNNLGVIGNINFLLNKASNSLVNILQHDDYIIDENFYETASSLFLDSNIALYYSNSKVEFKSTPNGMFGKNYDLLIKKFSNYNINKNIFSLSGINFINLLNSGLNTSWSSIIWRNDYLNDIMKFGSYIPNNEISKKLDIYNQEEAGAFMYLLSSKFNVAVDINPRTFRGVPDTRFSNFDNHPGKKNRNDVQFFIFFNLAKFFLKSNHKVFYDLSLSKAKKTGLLLPNKQVINYIGKDFSSIIFIFNSILWSYYQHLKIFLIRIPHRIKKYLFIIPMKLLK